MIMEVSQTEWHGFKRLDFVFEGRQCILVCPERPAKGNKCLFKTEYFDAFPGFELEMLERGYFVAYMQNITRWCLPDDIDAKARFCDFLSSEAGLNKKCMTVGMSCGGMHAVYFAAKYPQYTACMYIDAPVLNLLSCPCGVGDGGTDMYEEFTAATGMTASGLINYRNHPIDNVDKLIKAKIPLFLVCGDSDNVVPYHENGKLLSDKFKASDTPFYEILKPGCGHHPHGLEDNAPLIEFAEKYYK